MQFKVEGLDDLIESLEELERKGGGEMTKDAEYLLCILYREYSSRRDDGKSKSDSASFGSSQIVHDTFFAEWLLEDLDDTIRELDRLGYVDCLYADDTVYHLTLNTEGIAYMEQRFKNKFKEVLKIIAAFKP